MSMILIQKYIFTAHASWLLGRIIPRVFAWTKTVCESNEQAKRDLTFWLFSR
jgi:hypothetical protein